jgi:hypothetical protein
MKGSIEMKQTIKNNKIKRSTILYDLYVDGVKVGTSLFYSEMLEMMKEQRRYYKELGHKPKFTYKEV